MGQVLTVLTPSATVVAALATAVAAGFAGWAARAASRAAQVAEDSLEEVRRERELQVAPYLTLEWIRDAKDVSAGFMKVLLSNLGRGPAVGVLLVYVNTVGTKDEDGNVVDEKQEVRLTARMDIGVGQARPTYLSTPMPYTAAPPELYGGPPDQRPPFRGGLVMYCTSITRTAVYRFHQIKGLALDEPWYFGQDPPYWAEPLREFAPDLTPIAPPPLSPHRLRR